MKECLFSLVKMCIRDSPLIAYPQRQAGLSTAAQYALFILTVDWLGWICYKYFYMLPQMNITLPILYEF